MMRSRDWLVLLGLQIFVILFVVTTFKFVDRSIAGFVGGFTFTLLSLYSLYKIIKKRAVKKSLAFWMILLFFVLAVLPTFAYRIIYWGQDFQKLLILGVSTQEFHKFSEKLYLIMMVATLLDYIRFQAWERK